jgi:hypothetical protein
MNRDDIIRMAREAGHAIRNIDGEDEVMDGDNYHIQTELIERFANLVAAAERERIIAKNAPEIERVNAYIKALEDDLKQISSLSALCETLNKLHETAVQMIQPAVEMAVHKERAACANLCDEHHGHECAAAIRARGEK